MEGTSGLVDGTHKQHKLCTNAARPGCDNHNSRSPRLYFRSAGQAPQATLTIASVLHQIRKMTRLSMVVLVIFLTCFSWVVEAARLGGRGSKIVQPRVRPIMAGGVKQLPTTGSTKKKVDSKPKLIRIPFSPFEYDMAELHSTDLAFDMFWRSTPLL